MTRGGQLDEAVGLSPERHRLDQAWRAFSTGDFQAVRQLLPESLTDFGSSNWSNAAEAALIYALVEYACGELTTSLVHARMAQAGLKGEARDRLLLPTLLLQSKVALHRRQRDLAESLWQLASHLPSRTRVESCWQDSIAAIAYLASGSFDKCKEHALRAIENSKGVPAHLAQHSSGLVLAMMLRDEGQSESAATVLQQTQDGLEDFPYLPVHAELIALKAHLSLDLRSEDTTHEIDGVSALTSHPWATSELQDLVDCLEAALRIRTNEVTRAKVLTDRIEASARRTLLECAIDAESRPARTLGLLASGGFRWHRHQIEVEIIRARARRKDAVASAVQYWRAIERGVENGSVRPFLDLPLAALTLSNPEFLQCLEETKPQGEFADRLESHLEKILHAHSETALLGPETHALSARELEILRAVQAGGDFNTIAKVLVLSRWTVRGHFYSACRKLGVSGKDGAMARLRDIEAPRPHCSSS